MVKDLPQYDYIYLGDNARSPYGNRSFEAVHQYTLESVKALFEMGCQLIILACNTASAKALRSIQQNFLPTTDAYKRVLGVIRPTTELVGNYTKTGHVGILGTSGTVISKSYPIEIEKFSPRVKVFQQACPMWVPLVENNEFNGPGADYFVKKYLDLLFNQSPKIDILVLGCTHYPLLMGKIKSFLRPEVQVLSQSTIVANGLKDYLNRHPQMEILCKKEGKLSFYTSDDPIVFDAMAEIFFERPLKSKHLEI